MIAPEEWYEYQKQYHKYGIDMRPETDRVPGKEQRKRSRQAAHSKGFVLRVGSDHRLMLTTLLVCLAIMLSVVMITSYAAKVTYDINTVKTENDAISSEIEELDVKMLNSSGIAYIEGMAKDKLGMKSPDSRHCVYISASDAPEEGFADILREKAFN